MAPSRFSIKRLNGFPTGKAGSANQPTAASPGPVPAAYRLASSVPSAATRSLAPMARCSSAVVPKQRLGRSLGAFTSNAAPSQETGPRSLTGVGAPQPTTPRPSTQSNPHSSTTERVDSWPMPVPAKGSWPALNLPTTGGHGRRSALRNPAKPIPIPASTRSCSPPAKRSSSSTPARTVFSSPPSCSPPTAKLGLH